MKRSRRQLGYAGIGAMALLVVGFACRTLLAACGCASGGDQAGCKCHCSDVNCVVGLGGNCYMFNFAVCPIACMDPLQGGSGFMYSKGASMNGQCTAVTTMTQKEYNATCNPECTSCGFPCNGPDGDCTRGSENQTIYFSHCTVAP